MNPGFQRQERLSRQSEFIELIRHGRVKLIDGVLVYTKPSPVWRLGVSVSGRVGTAVKRNRIKRVLREVYRTSRYVISAPYEVLFLVKKPLENFEYHSFKQKYISWLNEAK